MQQAVSTQRLCSFPGTGGFIDKRSLAAYLAKPCRTAVRADLKLSLRALKKYG